MNVYVQIPRSVKSSVIQTMVGSRLSADTPDALRVTAAEKAISCMEIGKGSASIMDTGMVTSQFASVSEKITDTKCHCLKLSTNGYSISTE